MELSVGPEGLSWNGAFIGMDGVRGFVERYDRWTGRAWVEIRGPGWKIPISTGWGALRLELRRRLPDRPFTSEWDDGRFPAAPWGAPVEALFFLAAALSAVGAIALGWAIGPGSGALLGLVLAWPVARLRDAVEVGARGIRLGPIWSPRIPWEEVEEVAFERGGRGAWVRARTRQGRFAAPIPTVLLPALRARIRRQGGLLLRDAPEDLAETYRAWQVPAAGIPWGVLVGTGIASALVADPWEMLRDGLLAAAATATLGLAVEARATGWGFGAVGWLTLLYAGFLAVLAIAAL